MILLRPVTDHPDIWTSIDFLTAASCVVRQHIAKYFDTCQTDEEREFELDEDRMFRIYD